MPIHQLQITALLPMVTDNFLIFNNPNLKKLSRHEKQMLKCNTQGRCICMPVHSLVSGNMDLVAEIKILLYA